MQPSLGRLARVELRDIWLSESSHFTPWLAQPENLAVLADTLGIGLELEAQEKNVGPFRADLLCKDTGSGAWVLIENQLERTDHSHLGQLLTYASGLQAVTIVWIAARFTEEHRSTLDWLNGITDERFRFFGLEVELWRICESPAAPKFNIVSKPNNWSRSVAQAARAIDEQDLSETRLRQLAFWTAFHRTLDRLGGPMTGHKKPRPNSWMSYATGRTDFYFCAAIKPKKRIQAELYLQGPDAKAHFALLHRQKADIERELGCELVWDEMPGGIESRVAQVLDDADLNHEDDWPRQHDWLAGRLNAFHRVFTPRVRILDARAWPPQALAG